MGSRLKIWSNAQLPPDALQRLIEGVAPHSLQFSSELGSNLSAASPSETLEEANVAFGQPDDAQILRSESIKLVQITSAGYTRYDTVDFAEGIKGKGIALCNSSSIYAEPCAQHLLAFMLASVREIPASIRYQFEGQKWSFDELRPKVRLLKGQRVLIVGFGAIGRRLVQLLSPFELDIVALRRRPQGDEEVVIRSIDHIKEELKVADHVINIIPANADNLHLFGADWFESMKDQVQFYNIGRGSTVDQDALIRGLTSGAIAAAYLDVTDPEPLPEGHPLWKAPNCTITPHIGGGYKGEHLALVEHFLSNLRKFEAGETLCDRVY